MNERWHPLPLPYTLAAALMLAGIFVFGHKLRAESRHRVWVSIAGGISVSTVFIDLLPEISESQAKFANGHQPAAIFPEQAIYLAAMMGFVLFYGLQYQVAAKPASEGKAVAIVSSFRIAAFAGYCSLIAYLLVHNIWKGAPSLMLYSLAMAFHLHLIDHSLAEGGGATYERRGRWILVLAILAGWSVGIAFSIPEQWLCRITGFICGGVIMNTLVVELPEGRGGHFWPFALAAAAYSILLILIPG